MNYFDMFWKALPSTKTFIWLILGPLLEKFGYFLFQHLVTLTAFEQVWHERLTCFRAIKNQQKASSFRVSRLEKEMFCFTSAMEGKDLEQILLKLFSAGDDPNLNLLWIIPSTFIGARQNILSLNHFPLEKPL